LIISWQEGTLCGHSSGVRPVCRPMAHIQPFTASASLPLGTLRP